MGVYTGTVPTFLAGELPDADKFTEVSNFMTAATGPETDYSASLVIGASVTAPTKGAGTVYTAGYRRLGKWVDYTFSVTIGAGWVAGSGTYRIPVPVAPLASQKRVGMVYVQDFGTALLSGVCVFNAAETWLSLLLSNGPGGFLGSGGPGTAWAAGDFVQGSILYIPA